MRSENNWLNEDPLAPARGMVNGVIFSLPLWAIILMACLLCSCSTVAPRPPVDNVASWDGTNQNSGFIGWTEVGEGIITSHAADRYNGLIAVYGEKFIPKLHPGDGLRPGQNGTWIIDQEHLVKFAEMNRWRKAGK